jgi:hypothetical protein
MVMIRYGLIGAIDDNLNQMSLEVQNITELLEEARGEDLPEGVDMLLSEALDHLNNLL